MSTRREFIALLGGANSNMATRGKGAAAEQIADHRILGRGYHAGRCARSADRVSSTGAPASASMNASRSGG